MSTTVGGDGSLASGSSGDPRAASAAIGDPRIALRARGVLAEYNRAGVLTSADVHVARRLAELTGERDERVVLAVALAVRALRQGAVCVELADRTALTTTEADETAADLPWYEPDEWAAAIEASRLVAIGPQESADDVRPARWVAGRLYLDRYWRDEQAVRAALDERLRPAAPDGASAASAADAGRSHPDHVERAAVRAAVTRLFPKPVDDRQRLAAATAALSRVTVLTGGPGTGKTTTVATLLAALQDVAGGGLRIALAAPTGKAAARLQESVHAVVRTLSAADQERLGDLTASTVHRLLGWRSATRFRHDRSHRLPHDVVVVDETSMVSLPLMARLLEALRPQARLVLVGDPDQLASVEAGAVLGDLVARPPAPDAPGNLPDRLATVVPDDVPTHPDDVRALRNGVVRLTRPHRYDGALAELADAIRRGDADATLAVLRSGTAGVELVEPAGPGHPHDHLTDGDVAGVRADVVATGTALVEAARAGDAAGALRALEGHRLLVAHRRGPAGVSTWADRAERWVTGAVEADLAGPWPLGTPLLVTANDRDTGLSNGDTGVVVDDGAGGRTVAFGDPDTPRLVRPHRLPAVQAVHAMTVHRGQGSQFRRVSVVLPPATSPLLTRELLYTAVTRAQQHVRVVGTEEAIRVAVGRPVRRASGLREALPGTGGRGAAGHRA